MNLLVRNPEPETDENKEEKEEMLVCMLAVSLLGRRSFETLWVTVRISRPCWSMTLGIVKSGWWVGASSLKYRFW